MEELNESEQVKRPTIKEIYLNASGKEVRLDYFLFTCFEEEASYQALPDNHRRQFDTGRWPEALEAREQGALQGDHQAADLSDLLADLCSWYGLNYPVLKSKAPLDYSLHSEVLGPFVRLVLDLKTIIALKTGDAMPLFDPDLADQDQAPLWGLVAEQLGKHFESFAERMFAYLAWSCRKSKPKEYDLASLPPVGRFAAILQRYKRRKEGGRPGEWRSSGNDAGRGRSDGRGGRPPEGRGRSDGRSDFRARPEGGNRSDSRGGRPDHRGGEQRGDSSRSRGGPRARQEGSGRSTHHTNKSSSAAGPAVAKDAGREKEAMAEVDQAIAELKKSRFLKEVLLLPQNSFIRRKQHKKIVDSGYFSESAGEGPSRAVKILRKAGKKVSYE